MTGLTFAGTDPQDYLITSNGCLGPVACRRELHGRGRFRAARAGGEQRDVADRKQRPEQSGERVAVRHRRAVAARADRADRVDRADRTDGTSRCDWGDRADRGPGRAGRIELVACRTVTHKRTKNGRKVAIKVKKCRTRLVSGPVKFTIDGDDLGASVSRAGITYATGVAIPTGTDR